MIIQLSTFQSINSIKKSSFRTGFGVAKIRDAVSSFYRTQCDKNWIPHHATHPSMLLAACAVRYDGLRHFKYYKKLRFR